MAKTSQWKLAAGLGPNEQRSLRIDLVAMLYFGLVFGSGFLLGIVRVLLVEPYTGVRAAELLEAPLMLLAMLAAANWIERRYALLTKVEWLTVGVIALAMVLFSEAAVVVCLRGQTIEDNIASRDPV